MPTRDSIEIIKDKFIISAFDLLSFNELLYLIFL